MQAKMIAELIKDLESPNPGRVYGAAKILAEIGSPQAMAVMPYLRKARLAFLNSDAEEYIVAVIEAASKKITSTYKESFPLSKDGEDEVDRQRGYVSRNPQSPVRPVLKQAQATNPFLQKDAVAF